MEIYIEYIFLDNFAVNMFLLYLSLILLKKKASFAAVFCSGTLGAVFSALYPFLGKYNYIVKALLAPVMVFILRKYNRFSDFFSILVTFYILSFTLAGAVLMISAFSDIDLTKYHKKIQLFPFCISLSAMMVLLLCNYIAAQLYKRKRIQTLIYPVKIQLSEDSFIETHAFYDSGNHLADPANGQPMVIISKRIFNKMACQPCGDLIIKSVAGYKNIPTANIIFWIYFNNGKNKMYKARAGIIDDINEEYDLILHTEMIGE